MILIASGASKADIVRKAMKGPVTMDVPASVMQELPQGMMMLDAEAAGKL